MRMGAWSMACVLWQRIELILLYWSSSIAKLAHHTMLYSINVVLGEDFIEPNPTTLTFMSLTTMNGERRCTDVVIIDDENYEGDHQFTAELIPIEGPVTTGSTATISIQDDGILYIYIYICLFSYILCFLS